MINVDDFTTEEEYQAFLDVLNKKAHQKQELTSDEQDFFCRCASYDYQKAFPFCNDVRFKRLFLKRFDSQQNGYRLKAFEEQDLNVFLDEWETLMKKENNKERLMNVLSVETRKELKKILPNFSLFDKVFRRKEYRRRQHEIIGYAKFAYIKIKSIFEKIGSNKLDTRLNGTDIEIDEQTLAHVYMRHYGQLVRPYDTSDKSYFTPEVKIEKVPSVIKEIIDLIEARGIYANDDLRNINVNYKNRDYKIYSKDATKQVKGIGNVVVTRVSTFYPIELQQEVDNLGDYNLIKINNYLSVYIKK